MSITFSAPGTTPVLVGTFECGCGPDSSCKDCGGTGEIQFWEGEGEFNCHNRGAEALIRLLSLPSSYGMGEIPRELWPELRRKIIKARNMRALRASYTEEPSFVPGGYAGTRVIDDAGVPRIQRMGPPIHMGGIDDEYLLRHLDDMDRLLDAAEKAGSECIQWG